MAGPVTHGGDLTVVAPTGEGHAIVGRRHLVGLGERPAAWFDRSL